MIDKSKVLDIVKAKGPVLPREVVKEVGGDTFLVGAVLSQLVDDKQIKLSYAKIGGSPLYYYSGQEQKLSMLYDHLHEKEKRAYDLLKQKKIIKDSEADPLLKVLLRQIKDFAKALEVNVNGQKQIFWKWHLVSKEEVEKEIREIIKKDIPKREPETQISQPKKLESAEAEPLEGTDKKEQEPEKREPKKEEQEKLAGDDKSHDNQPDDELLDKITRLFGDKNIKILEKEVIRKNSDIEMTIQIPSEVGKLKYYCRVKDKKKTNDKDLSSHFVEGQMKNLPILYITTGELTKKAQEKLEKDFTTVTVLKI